MIDSFLKYLSFEKRYSPHTVRSYQQDITQFMEFFRHSYDESTFDKVTHIHVRSWLVNLVQNGNSNRSIARKISSLQTLFKYLIRKGVVDKNPLVKIIVPKIGKRLPMYIEHGPLEDFLQGPIFPMTSLVYGIALFYRFFILLE